MKILLVDDDPLLLETLAELLALEGFETLQAADGEIALHQWKSHKPHLICLDIMMPNMNGYQVCKTIRQKDNTTPILFLSAKNEEKDIIAGLNLGADDFIRKPFSADEVIARIRSALRRAYPTKSTSTIQLRDLTLYPEQLRAERNGTSIELTPREVKILQLLAKKPNSPITRDEFLDHCWGIDYFPDSRTLDQHIFTLRKKIQPAPDDSQIIETVRGIGYKFTP